MEIKVENEVKIIPYKNVPFGSVFRFKASPDNYYIKGQPFSHTNLYDGFTSFVNVNYNPDCIMIEAVLHIKEK